VAQAHLADINRVISRLNSGISEIIDRLESEDQSKIAGAISYLTEMAVYIRNSPYRGEISIEKSHVLEQIIRDTYIWRDKVQRDWSDLTKVTEAQVAKDTFGTQDTHREILGLLARANPLIARYGLFLQLTALTTMVSSYLDPTGSKFTQVKPEVEGWIKRVEGFKATVVEKASTLLGESSITGRELLNYRRDEVLRLADKVEQDAHSQASDFVMLMQRLEGTTQKMMPTNGPVSLALRYDDEGKVQDAAFID